MTEIQFEAKIWKQGNSYITTIPKEIVNLYGIKENDHLQISAMIREEKDVKEEIEINKLKGKFPNVGKGVIKHKNEVVANLNIIFYRTFDYREGGLPPGGSFKDLPKRTAIMGVIITGMFLPIAYEKKHYKSLIKIPQFRNTLDGSEIIEMETINKEKIKFKIYEYKKNILSETNNMINKIEFRGDLIK